MVTKIKYAAVVLLIAGFLPVTGVSGGKTEETPPCRQFVISGARAPYEQCVEYLERIQGRETPLSYEEFVGSSDLWIDLLDAVGVGDRRSLNIAFMLMWLMDGDDAGFLSEHIAQIIIDSPTEFLQRLRDAELDQVRASHLVLSTPLSYVDHPKKEITLLRRRVKAIESVDDPELKATRAFAVRTLKEKIEELESYAATEEGASR